MRQYQKGDVGIFCLDFSNSLLSHLLKILATRFCATELCWLLWYLFCEVVPESRRKAELIADEPAPKLGHQVFHESQHKEVVFLEKR